MVTTRGSNKRKAAEAVAVVDEAEVKRLRIESIDGQQAASGAVSSSAAAAISDGQQAASGAAAGRTPGAATAIDEVDKSDGVGAGKGPGEGPAGVGVPVAADGTGAVNDASGGGGGGGGGVASIAASGLEDEMEQARAALYRMQQEVPVQVASSWNRLFWKRGAFTRARLSREAAAAAAAAAIVEVEAQAQAQAQAQALATAAAAEEEEEEEEEEKEEEEELTESAGYNRFLDEQRTMWAECAEKVRKDRADFLASVEGPGAAAHLQLMEEMGAAGASEEAALAAQERLNCRLQDWQKAQFVAACGGRAFAERVRGAAGVDDEGAPAAAGAGTDTGGIAPPGGLFDASVRSRAKQTSRKEKKHFRRNPVCRWSFVGLFLVAVGNTHECLFRVCFRRVTRIS